MSSNPTSNTTATILPPAKRRNRMDKSQDESTTSLSTVDEIRRRLLRPSALHSQSSIGARQVSKICSSSSQFGKGKEIRTNTRTLEDYLNPVLLSAIRDEIGAKRKRFGGDVKAKEFGFEWPADELKALLREKRGDRKTVTEESAVDLGADGDVIGGVGDDDDGVSGTLFQRFEGTALKRFREYDG